jgi:methanogenic corrinoid protein MtbC1
MLDVEGIADACTSAERHPEHNQKAALCNPPHIRSGLSQIIESEVLPRLTLAHQEDQREQASTGQSIAPERVIAFAQSLVKGDQGDEQVGALLKEGLPLGTLLLDLLAPAARHLGRLWEEDGADFVDVTAALGRLHSLAHSLCARLEIANVSVTGRRVLLLPCPGETHLFSLALVASFFRDAGWGVVLAGGGNADAATLVRAEAFDLIGISLSCDVRLRVMADLVTQLRTASRNPGVRVMVGGPLFLRDPAYAVTVGADATAIDGRSAVQVAEALFA